MTTSKVMLVAAAAAAIVTGCTDDLPSTPKPVSEETSTSVKNNLLGVVVCTASTEDRAVSCEPPQAATPNGTAAKPGIILGGQNQFVKITSSNVAYNAGTGNFTFDVTIRNLIPQTIGVLPVTGAADPNGVRIFFASGPTVTSGTGTITVPTANGSLDFGGLKPFYQYTETLANLALSASKTWTLNMPSTVTTFSFTLLVSAGVKFPDGYIDLSVQTLVPPTDRQMNFTVRNANGTIDPSPGTITWMVDNPSIVEVNSSGLLNPLRAGTATVTAQAGSKIGSLVVNVNGITRTWTGSANTDWANGANWLPDGIGPGLVDSALVPVSATVDPTLSANVSIAGLNVENTVTLALNAFDFTASGNVATGTTGGITSSSGRLFLSGFAKTVEGRLPRIRVPGTYSLSANAFTKAPIQVDAGRLTVGAFRLQGDGF